MGIDFKFTAQSANLARWRAPPLNSLNINFDTAWKEDRADVGIRVVVRDLGGGNFLLACVGEIRK